MFRPNVKKLMEAGDVSGLVDVAVDGRPKKAEAAFYALTELSESALQSLTKELEGDDSERSLMAACAIAVMIEHGSADACEVACRGLQEIRETEVAIPLLEGLSKVDYVAAADAVVAFLQGPLSPLERPRTPLEIDLPIDRQVLTRDGLLGTLMAPDTRGSVLVPAFEVLIGLRDPRATPLFRKALHWRDPALEASRAQDVLTWGPAGPAEIAVRCAAARGLGEVRSSEGEVALQEAMADESERVRKAAVEALSKCRRTGSS